MKFISKQVNKIRRILPLIIVLFLYGTNILAQISKKKYSADLDSLWSQGTYINRITNDGRWTTLIEKFSEDKNITWVMSTDGSHKFQLPEGNYLNFSSDSNWFACISIENELITINLENFRKNVYPGMSDYSFSSDGTFIAALKKVDGHDEIHIINLKTQSIEILKNTGQYEWHPSNNILYVTIKNQDTIQLYQHNFENKEINRLFAEKVKIIGDIEVSDNGNILAFISTNDETNNLNYYDSHTNVSYSLSDSIIQNRFSNFYISDRKTYIDDNEKKVLFYLKTKHVPQSILNSDIQVWDSQDPWIQPRMELYKEEEENFLTAWYPKNGEFRFIETDSRPTSAMRVNDENALVYNQLQYEPLYKLYPNADIYLKNIKTGEISLVCKNQFTAGDFVNISPDGQYISYFKDNDWWVYDISNGRSVNLTDGMQQTFHNTQRQFAGDASPYGNPGWLDDGQIILYDEFDMWVMSADGNIKRRITKGREKNISYRINRDSAQKYCRASTINVNFLCTSFNLTNGIILKLFDNTSYKSGIGIWSEKPGIEHLFWKEGKIDEVHIAKDSEKLIFRQQRFNKPIAIYGYDLKKKSMNVIYQTNQGLLEYDLGTTEFIEYHLKDGTKLKGSLMYPANYTPGKKYPMIVEIYERKSMNINNFSPPSDFEMIGFNLLKYTMNDYFVLYPDISYTIGNPGISALNSVEAAVIKVLETGIIDEKRLGLIGHSFGGYETAFIVANTDIFAAAVAGAAVTDLVNYYHDINWEWKISQMERMENQQFRMGDSFYKIKEKYYTNSPMTNIDKITTPLFLWTGKMDTNINWSQSVNMFLGLKRLEKTSRMLLFDNEPHIIIKAKNQRDLSLSIFNWMETYVKKNEKGLK